MGDVEERFCFHCLILALAPLALLLGLGWWATSQFEAAQIARANTAGSMIEELDDLATHNAELQSELESARRALDDARALTLSADQWTFDDLVDRVLALPADERRELLERMGFIEQGLDVEALKQRFAELNRAEQAALWGSLPAVQPFRAWFARIGPESRRNWAASLPFASELAPGTIIVPKLGEVDAETVAQRIAALEEALAAEERRRIAAERDAAGVARERDRLAIALSASRASDQSTLAEPAPTADDVFDLLDRTDVAEHSAFFQRLPARDDFRRWFGGLTEAGEARFFEALGARPSLTFDLPEFGRVDEEAAIARVAALVGERDALAKRLEGVEETAPIEPATIALPEIGVIAVDAAPAAFANLRAERDLALSSAQDLRSALDASQAARSGLSRELAKLRADVETTRLAAAAPSEFVDDQRLTDLREKLRAARRDRDVALEELEDAEARIDALLREGRDAARLSRALDDARAELAARVDEAAALETSIEALRAELADARAETSRADVARARLSQRLRAKLEQSPDATAITDQTALGAVSGTQPIQLSTNVAFASGSAQLSRAGQRALDGIADEIRDELEASPSEQWRLIIEGHTDRRSISSRRFPSNWELSAARAASVARYLGGRGVPEDRILVVARAEFDPIDDRRTTEAYAKNRRIEFEIAPLQ